VTVAAAAAGVAVGKCTDQCHAVLYAGVREGQVRVWQRADADAESEAEAAYR